MDANKWTAEHREIRRIVLMSEGEAPNELAMLRSVERAAYGRYTGAASVPQPQAGTPQAAGLGSWVCSLNENGVQDRWYAARNARVRFERIRYGRWESHSQEETICYNLNLTGHAHQIEVDHHGLDLSDCQNPAAAIAKAQRLLAVA